MKQSFTVVPQGLIESGQLDLQVDETTGLVDFSAGITAGMSIFSKSYTYADEIKVDPRYLKSANLVEGLALIVGPVRIDITARSPKQAIAHVEVRTPDMNLAGDVRIDVSGEFISFQNAILSGVVQGFNVTLDLEQKL